ncbi:MAG TPA: cobaltochelatase subunit CobN [Acidimicrobiia bacterium]|nr:cobaltochelatase subunit CobN [Acidimicrobiia bacterium]
MILFLSTADTEILALRAAIEMLPDGFPPVRAGSPAALPAAPDLAGVDAVIVRLLGGRRAWEAPFDDLARRCAATGVALLAFGGEAALDPELTAASTVGAATIGAAFPYLLHGGPANTANLLRFVADEVLGASPPYGHAEPAPVPDEGVYRGGPDDPGFDPARPTVGVVFYRAHLLAGNTTFVDDLCAALEARGANPLACWCYSLRPDERGDVPVISRHLEGRVDAVVTTVLAMGQAGAGGSGASPGDSGADSWDVPVLARLDVPVVQAVAATTSRAAWEEHDVGLSPLDTAWSVALPEFDGRIISVPLSFKEIVDDGDDLGLPVVAYRTVADRVGRVAGTAARLAGLRRQPNQDKKIAVVLSAYPTKRGRIGNAVGLDTPASVVDLLHALRAAGYRVDGIPADGDTLMAELIDRFSYEHESLTAAQLERAVGAVDAADYAGWFAELPKPLRDNVVEHWGEPPGGVYVHDGAIRLAGLDLGHVLVMVQPPRGFGENPIAVYHSPDLPPTHHYLAAYRWLERSWGADAVVHVGKHGNLEWLPGKGVGLSAACGPDAALGDLPLVYPFVVNDPGEGTQAKRRAHAVIVDHLVPPMTRAEVYDDLARLERLLDEYYQVSTLDPAKLPTLRAQIWELCERAALDHDLDRRGAAPADDEFDDFLLHLDGYLCELKDAQIRGGLHTLGRPPQGDAEIDLLAALLRLPQGSVPSLRAAVAGGLGLDLAALLAEPGRRLDPSEGTDAPGRAAWVTASDALDAVDAETKRLLTAARDAGWPAQPAFLRPDIAAEERRNGGAGPPGATGVHPPGYSGGGTPEWAGDPGGDGVARALRFAGETLVPKLRATTDEITNTLRALDGRYVPAGPSGAPTRGMAHVLPTGRNFYSVDPKTLPTRAAWDVGRALADQVCRRHRAETGQWPASVGLVVWGTAAMRTHGDDIAEALALLGARPVWAEESGRVVGVEPVPLEELGRPRIDVTLRISGFFRDAFPHLVHLVDEAVELVGALDEPAGDNFVRANGADHRIFGAKPGAYGSGILPLLDSQDWESDDDLATVYLSWSGYAYGRRAYGVPAPEAMERRFALIDVAVKNQDNREHDIFDSDDYLQEHGGMVATVRALRGGRAPQAFFGDSADPERPRVRTLAEEARRVVRSRVLNPRWISAMMRHGYKGAFEMAATVDYLYGYDATARIGEDWMYEQVTRAYVADPEVRKFFAASNPWALKGIAERLLEAAARGLWQASDEAAATLQEALLEAEGWSEDRPS